MVIFTSILIIKNINKLPVYFILIICVFSGAYFFQEIFLDPRISEAIDRSTGVFFYSENQSIDDLTYEADSFALENILLGDGDFKRDRGFMTDIGYLSFLKGSGVIGLFIFFLHFSFAILKYLNKFNNPKYFRIVLISIMCLTFSFKELIFLEHGYIQSYILTILLIRNNE